VTLAQRKRAERTRRGRDVNIRENPPRLIAITDRSIASRDETLRRFERVARAAQPFTVMFQLRDRELPARERLAFGRELRALCTAAQQWFQVNDRCDLAVLLGADGVHLAEASVSAADARRVTGDGVFVTRACHEPERELEPGVDGWVLSPIFAERKGRAALGIGALARFFGACRGTPNIPRIYGLGGVTAARARELVHAGATGVAVVGAALVGEDVEALLAALMHESQDALG
jgi:thiamine-phosphate pyrophosphorylase